MADRDLITRVILRGKDEASAVFEKLNGVINTVKTALLGYVGWNVFKDSVVGAADFEQALSKVQARSGATAEEMKQIKSAAESIGPAAGATATEAAQGLEVLTAAGLSAKQSIGALPAVMQVAKIEGIGLEQAANAVTTSLSVMGLGAEDSGRAVDAMAAASNASKGSVAGFAAGLAEGGAAAKAYGLSLEDTLSVLAAFSNAGIDAQKGGTALAAVMRGLVNPASQARQELANLGITSGDLNTVIDGLRAAGPAATAAIAAFGEEAGPGLRALIQQGTAGLDDFRKQIGDSAGAAQKMSDTIQGNLKGALAYLASAWDSVSRAFSEPLLKPLAEDSKSFAESLRTVGTEVAANLGGALVSVLASAKEAVTAFIGAFQTREITDDLNNLSGALNGLPSATQVGAAAADVFSTAWNGVATTLNGVGFLVTKLISITASAYASIQEFFAKITGATEEQIAATRRFADEWDQSAQKFGDRFQVAAEQTRAALGRLTDKLGEQSAAAQQAAAQNASAADAILAAAAKAQTSAEKIQILTAGARDLLAAGKDVTPVQAELAKALQQTDGAAGGAAGTVKDLSVAVKDLAAAQQQQTVGQKQVNSDLLTLKANAELARLKYEELRASGEQSTQKLAEALVAWQQGQQQVTAAVTASIDPLAKARQEVEQSRAAWETLRAAQGATEEQITQAATKYAQAVDALVITLGKRIEKSQAANEVANQQLNADVLGAEAAAKLAQARGDETGAIQKNIEAKGLLIQQAQLAVNQAQAELAVMREQLAVRQAQYQADGVVTAQEQAAMVVLQQKIALKQAETKELQTKVAMAQAEAEAERNSTTATQEGNTALEQRIATLTKLVEQSAASREQIDQLAAALAQQAQQTGQTFDDLRFRTEALAKQSGTATDSVQKLNIAIAGIGGQTATAFDVRGIDAYNAMMGRIRDTIGGAKDMAKSLADNWQGMNNYELQRTLVFAKQYAENLNTVTGTLKEQAQTVRNDLLSAIQTVRDAMKTFADQQKTALQQDQVALEKLKATGDEVKLNEIDYRQKLKALQDQLAQAQAQSNREAIKTIQDRIALLNQEYQLRQSNLRTETQATQQVQVRTAATQSLKELNDTDLSRLDSALAGIVAKLGQIATSAQGAKGSLEGLTSDQLVNALKTQQSRS